MWVLGFGGRLTTLRARHSRDTQDGKFFTRRGKESFKCALYLPPGRNFSA